MHNFYIIYSLLRTTVYCFFRVRSLIKRTTRLVMKILTKDYKTSEEEDIINDTRMYVKTIKPCYDYFFGVLKSIETPKIKRKWDDEDEMWLWHTHTIMIRRMCFNQYMMALSSRWKEEKYIGTYKPLDELNGEERDAREKELMKEVRISVKIRRRAEKRIKVEPEKKKKTEIRVKKIRKEVIVIGEEKCVDGVDQRSFKIVKNVYK